MAITGHFNLNFYHTGQYTWTFNKICLIKNSQNILSFDFKQVIYPT